MNRSRQDRPQESVVKVSSTTVPSIPLSDGNIAAQHSPVIVGKAKGDTDNGSKSGGYHANKENENIVAKKTSVRS